MANEELSTPAVRIEAASLGTVTLSTPQVEADSIRVDGTVDPMAGVGLLTVSAHFRLLVPGRTTAVLLLAGTDPRGALV